MAQPGAHGPGGGSHAARELHSRRRAGGLDPRRACWNLPVDRLAITKGLSNSKPSICEAYQKRGYWHKPPEAHPTLSLSLTLSSKQCTLTLTLSVRQ